MVIYIPNHLKNTIPILGSLSEMITTYGKEYGFSTIDSFDNYCEYYSINLVKKFIELCLESEEFTEESDKENIINYLVKLFYSVKGTSMIFDYMEKYLGIVFNGPVKYSVSEVIFDIKEITVKDAQLYVDCLKGFLSALLYYGDLIAKISTINFELSEVINVSITGNIKKYKKFDITETFNI